MKISDASISRQKATKAKKTPTQTLASWLDAEDWLFGNTSCNVSDSLNTNPLPRTYAKNINKTRLLLQFFHNSDDQLPASVIN